MTSRTSLEKDGAETRATYEAIIARLAPLGLPDPSVVHADPAGNLIQDRRRAFGGTVIVNSGFSRRTTRDEAVASVNDGGAYLVPVGRPAIANPTSSPAGNRAPTRTRSTRPPSTAAVSASTRTTRRCMPSWISRGPARLSRGLLLVVQSSRPSVTLCTATLAGQLPTPPRRTSQTSPPGPSRLKVLLL